MKVEIRVVDRKLLQEIRRAVKKCVIVEVGERVGWTAPAGSACWRALCC